MKTITAEGWRNLIAGLETMQMACPRGPSVWPNKPITAIETCAFELIATAPRELQDELKDMFTWGLAEID